MAGCTGLVDEEDAVAAVDGDPVAQVPANVTTVARLDATAVSDDDGLSELAAAESNSISPGTGLLAFENRTGLDPLAATALLVFEVAGNGSAIGYIVDGNWSEDAFLDTLEETTDREYDRQTTHEESVIYVPVAPNDDEDAEDDEGDENGTESVFVGVHGDGRYVVGDEAAVSASLDVRYGDADPLSGPVRNAYDETADAPLTVASEQSGSIVPEQFEGLAPEWIVETFEDAEAVSRSYETTEAGIAIDLGLHAADEATATEIRETVPGALAYLAANELTGDELADELETIEVIQEETIVWLSYDGTNETVRGLLEEV